MSLSDEQHRRLTAAMGRCACGHVRAKHEHEFEDAASTVPSGRCTADECTCSYYEVED